MTWKTYITIASNLLKLAPLGGYRTYLAAAGLFGLGIYQLSSGDGMAAGTSITLALGLIGIHDKADTSTPTPPPA